MKLGWRVPGINQSVAGKALVLDGNYFQNGIGLPPNSELEYRLDKHFSRFEALIGIDDGNGKDGNVNFIVSGDGKELWQSGWVKMSDSTIPVSLDVSKVKKLSLRVNRGEGGGTGDQAEWVNAKLIR
jgi:alpha-galactosidase